MRSKKQNKTTKKEQKQLPEKLTHCFVQFERASRKKGSVTVWATQSRKKAERPLLHLWYLARWLSRSLDDRQGLKDHSVPGIGAPETQETGKHR